MHFALHAGIHKLPSRDWNEGSVHRLCSDAPCPPNASRDSLDEEILEEWQQLSRNTSIDTCPKITTVVDKMKWDMSQNKQTRKLSYTIKTSPYSYAGRRIESPR